jgi:hypothetical protein
MQSTGPLTKEVQDLADLFGPYPAGFLWKVFEYKQTRIGVPGFETATLLMSTVVEIIRTKLHRCRIKPVNPRRRWHMVGSRTYPNATVLLITADAGAAVTADVSGDGSLSCRDWPMKSVSCFEHVITLRGPTNGTRLNGGCFLLSRQTGVDNR